MLDECLISDGNEIFVHILAAQINLVDVTTEVLGKVIVFLGS